MTSPLAETEYELIAERYAHEIECNAYNALYERPATLSLLGDVSGKRVLDAGCGPGALAARLMERSAHVTGVDASARLLQSARARLGADVPLHHADLSLPMPFLASCSFQIVVCTLALHYLEDWRTPLNEFRRVLEDGGDLVLSVGHPMCDFLTAASAHYHRVELVRFEWPSYGVQMPNYRRPLASMINALIDAGFVLRKVLEPLPLPEMEERFPEDYKQLSRAPAFLHLHATRA